MGERPDDDDREDEEPAASPSADSPPERGDAEVDDPSDAPDDGDDADGDETPTDDGTADGETADEDEVAGDEEAESGPGQYEEPDLTGSTPSAEEWLEEHGGPENAPGMDMDAGDGAASDDGDADPDENVVGSDDGDAEATDREEGHGEEAGDGRQDDADGRGGGPKGTAVDDPIPEEAVESRETLAERGYDDSDASDSTADDSDAGASAEDGQDGSNDGTVDATDEDAAARDAREQAQRAAEDDGELDDAAKAETPVSTRDPGKNAPAGVGQPTPAGGGGSGGGTAEAFPDFDGEMAPDDQEQPLAEHIEEMTQRFLVVALMMGLVASVALLWSDDMINFLWYSFLGPDDGTCPGPMCPLEWRPHVYHPLSLLLARLKVAALVGFVAGLPVAVYQTYRFMRPGLYPHERRYYLAAVPTSLVLAVGGVAFAYFVVLPSLFIYFSAYSTQAAELAFALSDTFDLMVMLLGFFALIFQIPLLVMLAIMMGVTTRRWLEERRLYFWTGFGGVAFIFSPDPTGMAPLLVALTMIALFEGTLLLLRWTERSVALFSAKSLEARRPYAWALAAFAGYVVSAAPVPEGYYDQLPPVVTETLANYGYTALTPAFIAVGIVAVFELLGWIARRIGAGRGVRQGLQVRLAFIRARPAVWLLAVVVGYAGSPDPVILDVFRQVDFAPPIAVGVVFGLIVAYEALRVVLSYVRPE